VRGWGLPEGLQNRLAKTDGAERSCLVGAAWLTALFLTPGFIVD